MKKIYLLFIALLLSRFGFAQFSNNNYLALADKAFRNKEYYEAAFYYKKIAEGLNQASQTKIPFQSNVEGKKKVAKGTDINYVKYQLAESYRSYENYLEAEGWYYQVINGNEESRFPLVRLWYGICLRANKHFNEAIKQLEHFEKSSKEGAKYITEAQKEIENCRFAIYHYQNPALISIAKLQNHWNSDGSNYAVVQRDDNFWFTSSRLDKNDKKHLNRIYHFASQNGGKPEIINLSFDQKQTEFGTPALDPTGKNMYFTCWYKTGSKIIHTICRSSWTNGVWTKPQKLNTNVNVEGYNSIQPFVTSDGKRLFFVSNKPGGQGGDDIWTSTLDGEGNPIDSRNLGSIINSPLDEQAPYYDDTAKKLVYSSKGFTGLGGFDFFEAFNEAGTWSKPKNLGFPMNSAKDDLYYSPDPRQENKCFISSDRESDCCLELFEVIDKSYVISGHVLDCQTQHLLSGAKVSLIDSLTKQPVQSVTLNTDGKYSFKLKSLKAYELMLEKADYFTKVLPLAISRINRNDTLNNPDICLQGFKIGKAVVIENILYDYNKAQLRPESEKVLDNVITILKDNPKFKIELSAHTDSIGGEKYNLNLSQARAQSCVNYIISKGISEDRVFAKGYGKSKPIAPNSLPDGRDNPDGRQINRRTEFTVLKTE